MQFAIFASHLTKNRGILFDKITGFNIAILIDLLQNWFHVVQQQDPAIFHQGRRIRIAPRVSLHQFPPSCVLVSSISFSNPKSALDSSSTRFKEDLDMQFAHDTTRFPHPMGDKHWHDARRGTNQGISSTSCIITQAFQSICLELLLFENPEQIVGEENKSKVKQ